MTWKDLQNTMLSKKKSQNNMYAIVFMYKKPNYKNVKKFIKIEKDLKG